MDADIKNELGRATLEALEMAVSQLGVLDKLEEESTFAYVDRLMTAMMTNLRLKGVTLAFTSPSNNYFVTSKGTPPPLRMVKDTEWDEFEKDYL